MSVKHDASMAAALLRKYDREDGCFIVCAYDGDDPAYSVAGEHSRLTGFLVTALAAIWHPEETDLDSYIDNVGGLVRDAALLMLSQKKE